MIPVVRPLTVYVPRNPVDEEDTLVSAFPAGAASSRREGGKDVSPTLLGKCLLN